MNGPGQLLEPGPPLPEELVDSLRGQVSDQRTLVDGEDVEDGGRGGQEDLQTLVSDARTPGEVQLRQSLKTRAFRQHLRTEQTLILLTNSMDPSLTQPQVLLNNFTSSHLG